MKEYPLLLTPGNISLVESGQKTMTRRLSDVWAKRKSGDRLWIKTRYWEFGFYVKNGKTKTGKQAYRFRQAADSFLKSYRFDDPGVTVKKTELGWHRKSPLFMPKVAARLWLEITKIRRERLQEIAEECAILEGCRWNNKASARGWFMRLWNSINKKPGTRWQDNPMVWVIGFRKI